MKKLKYYPMQKQLFINILISFLVVVIWAGSIKAETQGKKREDSSTEGSIIITSEKVDLDNQKREANYSGGVKIVKGDIVLTCDNLKVSFYLKGEGIQNISAFGQVKIWWQDRYAEAEEATYDDQSQTIALSGSPKTWQGENMIRGNKITFSLKEKKVLVEGNVETIIQMGSPLIVIEKVR